MLQASYFQETIQLESERPLCLCLCNVHGSLYRKREYRKALDRQRVIEPRAIWTSHLRPASKIKGVCILTEAGERKVASSWPVTKEAHMLHAKSWKPEMVGVRAEHKPWCGVANTRQKNKESGTQAFQLTLYGIGCCSVPCHQLLQVIWSDCMPALC